jgi:hypothetical protein
MKKLILLSSLFLSLNSFAGLNITGTLTNSDTVKIGDNTSYARLTIIYNNDGKSIDVLVDLYKGKSSYANGKSKLPQVTQIQRVYSIDSATMATSPTSSFAAQQGKSLIDKELYWIHYKVGEMIVADNPTFVVAIVDIKL